MCYHALLYDWLGSAAIANFSYYGITPLQIYCAPPHLLTPILINILQFWKRQKWMILLPLVVWSVCLATPITNFSKNSTTSCQSAGSILLSVICNVVQRRKNKGCTGLLQDVHTLVWASHKISGVNGRSESNYSKKGFEKSAIRITFLSFSVMVMGE